MYQFPKVNVNIMCDKHINKKKPEKTLKMNFRIILIIKHNDTHWFWEDL